MARGGKREGAGRPKGVELPPVADKTYAAEVLKALDAGGSEPQKSDTPVIARLRELAFGQDLRISLDTIKYLLDKRDGKAVQPMDWGGKPISVIVDIASAVTRRASQGKK